VRALVPLIKGERMDDCIEKLVEVGVDAIVVWPAARSVARLDDSRRDARIAKYAAIARAAARQSGRAQVPAVAHADDLAAALAGLPDGRRFVLDPTSDAALDPAGAADVTVVSGSGGRAHSRRARAPGRVFSGGPGPARAARRDRAGDRGRADPRRHAQLIHLPG